MDTRSLLRTRWAALGAAVAVTLGGGGIGVTQALVESGEKPIYVPLDSPCRLADLRPAPFQVGPRSTPLGPDETLVLDGWGTVGNCDLPSDTAGLELNVTALEATEPTWLRLWPTDGETPETANLNPWPGINPVPNSVTVGLADADGTFNVYNRFGNVAVVIDVVGYYDDHNHDDRYYTETEVDDAIAASGGVAWASDDTAVGLDPAASDTVLTLTLEAPADGYIVVDAMANWVAPSGTSIGCEVLLDTTTKTGGHSVQNQGPSNTVEEWNDAVGFAVTAGSHDINLVCQQDNGVADDATVQLRNMTAVFSTNQI